MVDGLLVRNVATQGWIPNTMPDMGASSEMTIDYAAGNGEAMTSGVVFNFIPREGGNTFRGSFFGTAANSSFQGTNFTDQLPRPRVRVPNRLKTVYDYFIPRGGGPIRKDRVWFYSSALSGEQELRGRAVQQPDAGNANAWTYQPDLNNQAVFDLTNESVNTRLTFQASPRNKFNLYYDNQWRDYGFTVPTPARIAQPPVVPTTAHRNVHVVVAMDQPRAARREVPRCMPKTFAIPTSPRTRTIHFASLSQSRNRGG